MEFLQDPNTEARPLYSLWQGHSTVFCLTVLKYTWLLCLHFAAVQCSALYYTALHCDVNHCTALHCDVKYSIALHCTELYCTVM